MPTVRQKNLAKEIVENIKRKRPKNKQELVVSSGYSMNTATKQIPAVFNQKGVKQALEDYGFTEDNAKKVVASILLDEDKQPSDRLRAADMTFKVHGTYPKDNQPNSPTVIIVMPNELIKKNEPNSITVTNS